MIKVVCRPAYDGEVRYDDYDKESDISSLYVSMYKRDYYIHQDRSGLPRPELNNNQQGPVVETPAPAQRVSDVCPPCLSVRMRGTR